MTEIETSAACYTPLTPLAFLGRSAEVFADKDAVVYGDRRLTYREMAAQTTRVARALQASGVLPGDRVAYLLPNIPEMLVAPLRGAAGRGGAGRRQHPARSRRSPPDL